MRFDGASTLQSPVYHLPSPVYSLQSTVYGLRSTVVIIRTIHDTIQYSSDYSIYGIRVDRQGARSRSIGSDIDDFDDWPIGNGNGGWEPSSDLARRPPAPLSTLRLFDCSALPVSQSPSRPRLVKDVHSFGLNAGRKTGKLPCRRVGH